MKFKVSSGCGLNRKCSTQTHELNMVGGIKDSLGGGAYMKDLGQ